MAPSRSSDNKYVIAMYVPKLICPSNATYKPQMTISSCADIRQLCQYICLYEPTASDNVTRSSGINIVHIFSVCP